MQSEPHKLSIAQTIPMQLATTMAVKSICRCSRHPPFLSYCILTKSSPVMPHMQQDMQNYSMPMQVGWQNHDHSAQDASSSVSTLSEQVPTKLSSLSRLPSGLMQRASSLATTHTPE